MTRLKPPANNRDLRVEGTRGTKVSFDEIVRKTLRYIVADRSEQSGFLVAG